MISFQFTAQSKTDLLNQWLALIKTGRYRHFSASENVRIDLARMMGQFRSCEHAEYASAGSACHHHPECGMQARVAWRHPVTLLDELLHDDHPLACSQVAVHADTDLQQHTATRTPPRRKTGWREADM